MKKWKIKKFLKYALLLVAALFLYSVAFPQKVSMPVVGASKKDYNRKSFWAHPWGKSGTHKGVDIFAKKGTRVNSPVKGRVVRVSSSENGGKYVIVMDAKLRYHYLAHLDSITVKRGQKVNHSILVGTVGNTGNAKGKPPHLHYAIVATFPHFWKIDRSPQGWKKAIYLNPIRELEK